MLRWKTAEISYENVLFETTHTNHGGKSSVIEQNAWRSLVAIAG